jgi:hypothetical protein
MKSAIRLLEVCRQIRAEAHDIFWSENAFCVIFEGVDSKPPVVSVAPIASNTAKLIKNFTVEVITHSVCSRTAYCLPYAHSPLDIRLGLFARLIRLLRAQGIPASSIRLGESPKWNSPIAVERVLATGQGMLEERLKRILQTTPKRIVRWVPFERWEITIVDELFP